MPLITRQDLINRTRISAQLSERQVLPFIEDAETYDLPTLLSGNLIADVQAFNITAEAWNSETPYLTGEYAIYGNIYYKALQGNNSNGGTLSNVEATPLSDTEIELTWQNVASSAVTPGTNALVWQPDYKATLRYKHLPEFLVWSAYARLLLEIGRNPTEAGLTVPQDGDVYQQASDKARAELMQSAKDKAAFHRSRIERFLSDYNLITRESCTPVYRRGSGRITAI